MPKIEFAKKNFASFEVPEGANLMHKLLDHDVPVASSCHGDGVCAKCRIIIVSGEDRLSEQNETEEHLRATNPVKSNERISCQTQVLGDIVIDASYW